MEFSSAGAVVTQASLNLAQAIATRLCHDLAGGLGTLMGTLELAGEDPSMAAEAQKLANDTATALVRRLRLLRVAWGQEPASMQGPDIVALAHGLAAPRRVNVRFEGFDDKSSFSGPLSQLILNGLMLATESLAGEGSVLVSRVDERAILITITGPRAAWPTDFAELLHDPKAAQIAAACADARQLQAPLTAMFSHADSVRSCLLLAADGNTLPALLLQQR